MHFARTYSALLLNLPPDLTANAIEYKKLKKLINQVVNERTEIFTRLEEILGPGVLQELVDPLVVDAHIHPEEPLSEDSSTHPSHFPKVIYELSGSGDRIEPRLRLWVHDDAEASSEGLQQIVRERSVSPEEGKDGVESPGPGPPVESPGRSLNVPERPARPTSPTPPNGTREVIIPLVSDTAFFTLLTTALHALSAHLLTVHREFTETLETLTRDVSSTARPVSVTSGFSGYSKTSDPAAVRAVSQRSVFSHGEASKSDLYSWRGIFQTYIEAEVFESIHEKDRGERTVEDSEERLRKFLDWVGEQGFVPPNAGSPHYHKGNQLKLQQSRKALSSFLQLNIFILNLKKFQLANSEATRKILKKHAKRTSIPFTGSESSDIPPTPDSLSDEFSTIHIMSPSLAPQAQFSSALSLLPKVSASLPRILVQAISMKLLPIIPHVDDYACLICMSIAFKPIRLVCGHLFCVRCLVKMQKRRQGTCPMCRAPSVLAADRSNVDWALLNFMQDWFPVESRLKLRQNEEEASAEEMAELGVDIGSGGCVIC